MLPRRVVQTLVLTSIRHVNRICLMVIAINNYYRDQQSLWIQEQGA